MENLPGQMSLKPTPQQMGSVWLHGNLLSVHLRTKILSVTAGSCLARVRTEESRPDVSRKFHYVVEDILGQESYTVDALARVMVAW